MVVPAFLVVGPGQKRLRYKNLSQSSPVPRKGMWKYDLKNSSE